MAEYRGTKALELWCRRMVEGYPGVKIDNMTTSWRDGLAFCAIIHHFRPELIDFAKLNKDDIYYNNDLAFTVAEKHLGIPALLEPGDMVEYEVPDRLSILTYVAQFYRAFATSQASSQSRMVPKRPAAPSERGIVSPASTSPPTKIINKAGITRRDPCTKCGLPVFIAERLNVGKGLFHRTCFKCARCNSQLSLANYYETDSNQYCCETCPDEETQQKTPESLQVNRLSDEEKSSNSEKKQQNFDKLSDSYSCMFESALESNETLLAKSDSSLSNQFVTARSRFLTMQVDSPEEKEVVPELPKTTPPSLKTMEETNKNISECDSAFSVNKNKHEKTSEKTVNLFVNKNQMNDQPSAASKKDSFRAKSVVTKDIIKNSDKPTNSNNSTSVRDRMKLFETPPNEPINSKPLSKLSKPLDKIQTSSPFNDNASNQIRRISLSPITALELPSESPSKLNTLLEKQLLRKSRTSPSIHSDPNLDLKKSIRAESKSTRSAEDLYQRKHIEGKIDVSAIEANVVDVGVCDSAPAVVEIKAKDMIVQDDHVSEKSLDKDDCEVLGDGDLKEKEDISETRSYSNLEEENDVITIEDSSMEKSIREEDSGVLEGSEKIFYESEKISEGSEKMLEESEEISEESKKVMDESEKILEVSKEVSEKSLYQQDSISVIEISDDSRNITENANEISNDSRNTVDISHEKSEGYPKDLNPFGEEDEENGTKSPIVEAVSPFIQKSLNPFGDDDDDEENGIEEKIISQKPIPMARKNLPPKEEKKEKSLNPFDEDSEEEKIDEHVKTEAKTPVKKKIPAPPLQTDQDTPEMIYVKRISIAPSNDRPKVVAKKVIAAPRISLTPIWMDMGEEDDKEEENSRHPVPIPRKIRTNPDQYTPEKKLGDQHLPSIFGSNSSLSSANSGGQSVRKKKPAPRPPILSPDKQESAQSSLTSSPSTSAQHSPRLSASKNRKTKRAPPPPTSTTPRNLFEAPEIKNSKSPDSNEGTDLETTELSFIEKQNILRDWDQQKEIKNEENRTRQSLSEDTDIPRTSLYIPNKSTYGKWKKKKGPAPSRPIPQKRMVKQLPMREIKKELDLIELQQQGLERQGVRLEQIIRERCEGPELDPSEVDPIDVDDLMLQLFEVVNEKNELCRRQAELMYLKRQNRLEEEHAEVEYELRCLMMEPEATKTDSDKAREEELISRLVEIVERRNEIIECLEIDRLRENDEDMSITNSMNTYAARRDEVAPQIYEEEKKEKKKKKILKLKFSKKADLDKDVDESESGSLSSNKEKKKKKFALF